MFEWTRDPVPSELEKIHWNWNLVPVGSHPQMAAMDFPATKNVGSQSVLKYTQSALSKCGCASFHLDNMVLPFLKWLSYVRDLDELKVIWISREIAPCQLLNN